MRARYVLNTEPANEYTHTHTRTHRQREREIVGCSLIKIGICATGTSFSLIIVTKTTKAPRKVIGFAFHYPGRA